MERGAGLLRNNFILNFVKTKDLFFARQIVVKTSGLDTAKRICVLFLDNQVLRGSFTHEK